MVLPVEARDCPSIDFCRSKLLVSVLGVVEPVRVGEFTTSPSFKAGAAPAVLRSFLVTASLMARRPLAGFGRLLKRLRNPLLNVGLGAPSFFDAVVSAFDMAAAAELAANASFEAPFFSFQSSFVTTGLEGLETPAIGLICNTGLVADLTGEVGGEVAEFWL